MADLTVVNSSYQTGAVDTATTLVDNTDDMLARHVNGPNSAIIQIETILGDGPTLKGSVADLVTRLAVALAATGKLNDFSATTKTTFPGTVGEGCTGATSFTANGAILGNGTSALQVTAAGSAGQVLRVPTAGGTPAFAHLIPPGTPMVFFVASAPSGWTQVTTQNDKALRVVSGTGAGTGGATAFSSVFGSGKATGSTAADLAAHTHTMGNHTHTGPSHTHDMGNHTHAETYDDNGGAAGTDGLFPQASTGSGSGITITTSARITAGPSTNTTGAAGTGATGAPSTNTTDSTGSGGGHTHTLSLDLQYADVIICSKD